MKRSDETRSATAQAASKDITLRVADVLGRIPPKFLKPGPHDTRCELRFNVDEVSEKIARGRASLPLTRIAELCPQIFRSAIQPEEDMDIPLPLQKLVEQLGVFAISPAARKPPAAPAQKAAPAETQAIQQESAPAASATSATAAAQPKAEPWPQVLESKLIYAQPPTAQPPIQPPEVQAARVEPDPVAQTEQAPSARNGSAEGNEPGQNAEPTISLALAPIFRLLPGSVARYAPIPDAAARIKLPLRLIEPQLARGHVEIPLDDFMAALPENVRLFLMRAPDVKVWLPLDEIFQNLPESHSSHLGSGLDVPHASSPSKSGESERSQRSGDNPVTAADMSNNSATGAANGTTEPSAESASTTSAPAQPVEKTEAAAQAPGAS